MPLHVAKKYTKGVLDQARKMFLLGGSGTLIVFIVAVTFLAIYMERREVAQLVKSEEKKVENTMEGFGDLKSPVVAAFSWWKTEDEEPRPWYEHLLLYVLGGFVIVLVIILGIIITFDKNGIFAELKKLLAKSTKPIENNA